MTKVDFRKIIRRKLKARKLSIPMLARQIECNSQTIYNYMAGRSEISAAMLEKIFAILSIKIS